MQYSFSYAGMAELVDAHDSKSCSFGSGSSILPSGTTYKKPLFREVFLFLRLLVLQILKH